MPESSVDTSGSPALVSKEADFMAASENFRTANTLYSGTRAISHTLLKIIPITAVLIIPCLWQRRIEAGDLRSHVYNAWLAQLIEQGELPGLWIVRQKSNVLFDLLLSALGRVFALQVAGRISAAIAVLVFFWGTFLFVAAITRRAPWHLVPLIAMLSYGWTYEEGVFNYYLSVGLAFVGLAIYLGASGWRRYAAVIFVPLAAMAHMLGLFWMLGAAAYLEICRVLKPRSRGVLFLLAILGLGALHVYLWHRFRVASPPHTILFFNGLDQLIFTKWYEFLAIAIGVFIVAATTAEMSSEGGIRAFLQKCVIPIQLYLIVEAAIQLLPDAIWLPQYAAPLSNLAARLTSISAVLICCALGFLRPRKWHLAALSGLAVVFFSLLYQDTARLVKMEDQVKSLLTPLPSHQRILATIRPPLKYRFNAGHLIEPTCVGRCFSYGNYEAPTEQFRIRASAGNGIVVSEMQDASAIEDGSYVVQASDLPAYQVYQCGPEWTSLCVRPLRAGAKNDPIESTSQ